MEALLHRTMRFDKADMGVHRQILCHHHVGVEPHGRQSKTLGFSRSMYDQMPAKTLSLKPRAADP